MKAFKFTSILHKWLSLLVGLQLLIWIGTGLYFNLMDSAKASGEKWRQAVQYQSDSRNLNLLLLSQLKQEDPIAIELVWRLNQPYYQLIYQQSSHPYQLQSSILLDAVSGQVVTLNSEQILAIAQSSYTGDGTFSSPALEQPPFSDFVRQQNPMWQVKVDDELNTVIYLDGVNGAVLKHVNDDVRLKQLMLKLHFMDYFDSGGFNHALIIVFALATLLFSITGVVWLVTLYNKGLLRPTRIFKGKVKQAHS